MKQAILKKKYSNISTADYGIPAVRPEGGELSMDKMILEINRAIERKYQDIKETGKIWQRETHMEAKHLRKLTKI